MWRTHPCVPRRDSSRRLPGGTRHAVAAVHLVVAPLCCGAGLAPKARPAKRRNVRTISGSSCRSSQNGTHPSRYSRACNPYRRGSPCSFHLANVVRDSLAEPLPVLWIGLHHVRELVDHHALEAVGVVEDNRNPAVGQRMGRPEQNLVDLRVPFSADGLCPRCKRQVLGRLRCPNSPR